MSSGLVDKSRGTATRQVKERRLSDDSDYQNNKRTHSVVNEMILSVLNDDDDVASQQAEATKGSAVSNLASTPGKKANTEQQPHRSDNANEQVFAPRTQLKGLTKSVSNTLFSM